MDEASSSSWHECLSEEANMGGKFSSWGKVDASIVTIYFWLQSALAYINFLILIPLDKLISEEIYPICLHKAHVILTVWRTITHMSLHKLIPWLS